MEQEPVWPKDDNGNNLRFGDMTENQRAEQTKWALRHVKAELRSPEFIKAVAKT